MLFNLFKSPKLTDQMLKQQQLKLKLKFNLKLKIKTWKKMHRFNRNTNDVNCTA